MRLLTPFACLLLPIAALAQNPPSSSSSNAEATAEANANANSSGGETKKSSQSSTHKVVVVNGKTIVDEKTVNGKPVGSGKRGGKRKPGRGAKPGLGGTPGLGLGGTPPADLEAMKRDMMRKLKEQMDKDMKGPVIRPPLRIGPKDLPRTGSPDMDAKLREMMDKMKSQLDKSSKGTSSTKKSSSKNASSKLPKRGKLIPRKSKKSDATRRLR